LDDLDVLAQARSDPRGLLARGHRLVLDEIQRAPELLLEIKRAVDESPTREPGRFVLTGSANLLLMDRISDSLAGRAGYVTLWPLTRGELAGEARAGGWDVFFDEPFERWADALTGRGTQADWHALAGKGGYPVPAYELEDPEERTTWFTGYVETYLQRDLQQLAAIEQLGDFRRLMTLASLRLGGILNQAELARDADLSHATAHRYLSLLETSFQVLRLEPFAGNRTKRLVKSPKLYWSDTALALHLSRGAELSGAHLENLILTDLMAWRGGHAARPEVLYWRTYGGTEVDFVIERQSELVALEIKSTKKPGFGDIGGLRAFEESYGSALRGSVVLHGGTEVKQMSERVLAVPWWRVL